MIVKPTRLGVLRRVASNPGGSHLRITALGAFDLRAPGDFLTEAQLWQTAAPVLGASMLDAGMPKPCAEVLVAGDACAPAGHPLRGLVVNLELGPIRKRLVVFGRRWWRYGPDGPLMTAPEPFERIPLEWSNAFGGPDHAENPLGKGADAKAAMSRGELAELPMVETPESLITEIDHRPAPAGLGPRAEDAASRLRFAGAYDEAWLRDDFPGLGRGFDQRYYNVACPDQQTDSEIRGDERFRITSMHPDHMDLHGRLPGFRVRAFARRDDAMHELPVRCDTVWLFPNALMGIVLFRGGLAVADKEASDVVHVMLAYERLGDPARSLAHYRTAFEERTDPEQAALKFFDERPLKPERLHAQIEAVEEERRALAEDMARRREQAREHAVANALGMAGLPAPPAGLFSVDSPVTAEIPVVTPGEIERLEVDLVGMKAKVDALADQVGKENESQLARVGHELAQALPKTAQGSDPRLRSMIDDRLSQISTPTGGRPVLPAVDVPEVSGANAGAIDPGLDRLFDRAGQLLDGDGDAGAAAAKPGLANNGMSVALRRAQNRALGVVDKDDPFAGALASLATQAASAKDGAGSGGRPPGGAGSASTDKGMSLFDTALQAIGGSHIAAAPAGREKATNLNSRLADPRVGYFNEIARHLEATGASADTDKAPEAGLEDARSKLEEARERFDQLNAETRRSSPEPIAPDEPLSDLDAAGLGALALTLAGGGEGLRGRDLAGANLSGADLASMDLGGIFLERANLSGANFAGARLHGAVMTGADLTGADLTGADLTDSNLSSASLAHAQLCNARLDRAQLFRSRFDGADLDGASLTDVSLIEVSMAGARLTGATIHDAQFLKCDLSNIALDGARLNKVVFVESDTSGFRAPAARFERCALIGLQGENADLTEAEFVRSACIGDAKLGGARMAGLISTHSGWRGADLSGADLTAARLDESDLGETKLTDACLHRASLKRTVLRNADATGANFYGATLLEAQVQDANFRRASLHRANLYSADLTDADLALCDLAGANLTLTVMTKPANAG